MSGIQPTSQLTSNLATHPLPGHILDKFHAFSITTLTDPTITSRWVVSEETAAASRLGNSVWMEIFKHLKPREIFSFIISARIWSQSIDLNLLRSQFVLLNVNYEFSQDYTFFSILSGESTYGAYHDIHPIMYFESLTPLTLETWESISNKTKATIPYTNVKINDSAVLQVFLAQNNQQLPDLEEIHLSSSDITIEDLQATLRAAPHLKSLVLRECKNITSTSLSTLQADSLPELEVLALQGDVVTAEFLKTWLKAAPNLKELNLAAYFKLNFRHISGLFEEGSLKSLQSLCFNHREIDMSEDLQTFLRIAPNLKSISILSARNINGDFTYLQPGSLPALGSLCIAGPEVTMADLRSILLAAPNLKELDLLEYTEDITVKFPPLNPSLEQVRLQGYITNYLQAVLQAAPNLKEIDIHDNKIDLETALSGLEENALPALTSLSLTKTNSSSDDDYRPVCITDILSILRVAPNLKELKFKKSLQYYNIEIDQNAQNAEILDFSQLSEHFFPHETKITVSNITVAGLEALSQALPHSRFIQLNDDL